MKKKLLILFLAFCTINVWAQENDLQTGSVGTDYEHIDLKSYHFVSVGIGVGSRYGNLGAKLQWRATKSFGLSVGIGTRGIPLNYVYQITSNSEKDLLEHGIPFTNKTLGGLSFTAGFDFWIKHVYLSLHYAQFGRWLSLYDNKYRVLQGGIYSVGGDIPLGKIPLAITVGGSLGIAGGRDPFMTLLDDESPIIGLVFSIDFGIVYKFKY